MKTGVEVELKTTGNLEEDLASIDAKLKDAKAAADRAGASLDKLTLANGVAKWSGSIKDAQGNLIKISRSLETTKEKTDDLVESMAELSGSGGGFSLGGSFLANFAANLASQGIESILGALGSIQSAVVSAASQQTLDISSSSDIATNLGISLAQAKKLNETTQLAIAQIAADLPGLTSDYNEILRGISPAISDALPDPKAFQETLIDITKRAGVLSSTKGADPAQAGGSLNRFIAGTAGFEEIMGNDLFQKNAQFQKALRQGLTNLGKSTEDWKELTTQQRLAITQDALRIATPDSLINEFKGTTDSLIQGIQTTLFDPLLGAFGFLRRVADRGNRSALDGVQGFLASWLRFTDSLGEFMTLNGLDADPMSALIGVLDWLADLGDQANEFVLGLRGQSLSEVAQSVTKGLADLTNQAIDGFNNLLDDPAKAGQQLADAIWYGLGLLGNFLANLDWGAIAEGLLKLLVVSLVSLNDLLGKVWDGFVDGLDMIFEPMVDQIGSVFQDISKQLLDLLERITGWLGSIAIGATGGTLSPVLGAASQSGLLDTINPVNVATKILGGSAGGTSPLPVPASVGGGNLSLNSQVTVNAQTGADANEIARMSSAQTIQAIADQFRQAQLNRLSR